ncbi:mannose/glucose-specific lectin-like [Zingiber officinale]|uniref:Jacalin-type lectin domain-containing protein n=1 Tax=Zingiber officinale TaxID=94328 RepID=A0A8J5LR29_ZINOF|nr:mannose/glucose-specific lectin-like [Zingiber officinale]KAG6526755.1 hypothetical protein ZIOFF_016756 [Zingiber officinale]
MVGPSLNFNVDVNKCFGGLWKSRRRSKAGIKIGPWGTPGACSFDIAASASQLQGSDSTQEPSSIAWRSPTLSTGKTSKHFELQPGEYINSMVGSVNDLNGETCIAKLGFATNFGNTHGPFGAGGGKEYSVPVVDGRIVGFFGQYDKYLKAIGVYLAPN